MTSSEALFYAAFLGQIALISHYFPRRIVRRLRHVLDTYHQADYPKLYPKPQEYYRVGVWIFEQANRAIVVLGIVLLLAIMFWVDHANFADDGYISEFWPGLYGAIQFVPLLVLELTQFGHFRLMQRSNPHTVRKAALAPRKLFNFISPRLLTLAVATMATSIFYGLSVSDSGVQNAIVTLVTNGFIVALGAWILYGRKPNPHQATEDRTRQIGASLRSFAYLSITMSVFTMLNAADQRYDLDYLDAALLSIYFQVVACLSLGYLLRSQSLTDLNFDVYRADDSHRGRGHYSDAKSTSTPVSCP